MARRIKRKVKRKSQQPTVIPEIRKCPRCGSEDTRVHFPDGRGVGRCYPQCRDCDYGDSSAHYGPDFFDTEADAWKAWSIIHHLWEGQGRRYRVKLEEYALTNEGMTPQEILGHGPGVDMLPNLALLARGKQDDGQDGLLAAASRLARAEGPPPEILRCECGRLPKGYSTWVWCTYCEAPHESAYWTSSGERVFRADADSPKSSHDHAAMLWIWNLIQWVREHGEVDPKTASYDCPRCGSENPQVRRVNGREHTHDHAIGFRVACPDCGFGVQPRDFRPFAYSLPSEAWGAWLLVRKHYGKGGVKRGFNTEQLRRAEIKRRCA